MGGGDDLAAEGRLRARAGASAVHPLKRRGDPLAIVLRGALRRQTGHGHLQGGGYLGDRSPVVLMGPDKVDDRVAHRLWGNSCDPDPASHPDLEQSLGVERPHSLPDDRPRNPELLAQLALWGQGVAGSQTLRGDRLEDLLRHAVRETRPPLKST